MLRMDKQSVLIGEIVLDHEPRISLYADTLVPLSKAGVAVMKDKLANILDTRFRPAAPPLNAEMTIDEVTALWHCPRATVLRRIRAGEIHPIQRDEQVLFDRSEVEGLT